MSSDPTGPKRPPRPGTPRGTVSARATGSSPGPSAQPGAGDPTPTASVTATIDAPPAGEAADVAPEPTTKDAPVVAVPAVPAPKAVAHSPGGRRRRGRRVTRVVRRIDLWSVLKLSLIVYSCLYAAALATLAALWSLAYSSGSIDKLQSFLEDVGLENFTFYGNQMFRACAAIGGVGVLAGTVITVLATALVNVISEMSGGIRLVVIEEDVDRT